MCFFLDPFINTGKGVGIFLKGLEKSVVNFGCICSLVREELDDYAPLDFSPSWDDSRFLTSGGRKCIFAKDAGKIRGI
jgi:hypothetical protein